MLLRVLLFAGFLALLMPTAQPASAEVYIPTNDTSDIQEAAFQDSVCRQELINSVIQYSQQFIGTPYRYGAMDPRTGFDCSHFVSYCYASQGVKLPVSSMALSTLGTEVDLSEVRKGDLMFFKGRSVSNPRVGHVSLVIDVQPGSIKMIHATHRGVIIDEYFKMDYYKQRFLQARRISW